MQTHDNFQVGMRELIKVCQLILFILVLMPNGPFSLTAYSSFCGWSIAGQPYPPLLPLPPRLAKRAAPPIARRVVFNTPPPLPPPPPPPKKKKKKKKGFVQLKQTLFFE